MLDFNKTAPVLIDLQKGILEMPTAPHTTETVVSNAKELVELFRKENGFITFVRVKFHDGKDKLAPNAMKQLPAKKCHQNLLILQTS
ncbi:MULTISPECIES: isochorismatase family protein [unclassified Streptococcus]|uniref:isochorismatase family protein n=1 Tax=unclassified Streptococcus TaxID=2608887 RepID=UPI000A987B1B|nr:MULTISPECIES: isochorismatase family protein [unclassified Streptococcus]